jgi:hypothetical protein
MEDNKIIQLGISGNKACPDFDRFREIAKEAQSQGCTTLLFVQPRQLIWESSDLEDNTKLRFPRLFLNAAGQKPSHDWEIVGMTGEVTDSVRASFTERGKTLIEIPIEKLLSPDLKVQDAGTILPQPPREFPIDPKLMSIIKKNLTPMQP